MNYVPRARLQLVGVCALLLAAKYEEIWPPEIKECVHISANTYSREEIIVMERSICAALGFRLTVPTVYPFAARLWSVLEDTDFLQLGQAQPDGPEERERLFSLLQKATCFFLEHAVLDYKCLQFTPSQVANAAVYLALLTLRLRHTAAQGEGVDAGLPAPSALWSDQLRHYSKTTLREFRGCAEVILEHVHYVPTTKYQAVRRKYSSSKYGEIAKMLIPDQLPQ
ncbi:cyclin A [Strigomonas culicis]|nr:cyclin A [Strigomonas culicis]EPY33671.1 cyclin A [Strigomonas culicis]|eukprot:EPY33667.1 cyclin A [Strigomonas culicis]